MSCYFSFYCVLFSIFERATEERLIDYKQLSNVLMIVSFMRSKRKKFLLSLKLSRSLNGFDWPIHFGDVVGTFWAGNFEVKGKSESLNLPKFPLKSSFAISSHPKPTANSTHVFVHYISMFSFSFNSFFSLNGNKHKKQVNCP